MSEREATPQVRSLAGLIDYQEGAVVSRTMISKAAGTVTVFAFDQGQGLSEHTTPYDALLLAVEGEMRASIGSDQFGMRPGEFLLLPANRPHAIHASSRCKMLLIMIRE